MPKKIILNETTLKQIICESIKNVLLEEEQAPFGGVPGILRQDPSKLSDEELVKCLKYLSVNADEYTFSKEAQYRFDRFWDEHNRRQ